jgi:hypothetical protein
MDHGLHNVDGRMLIEQSKRCAHNGHPGHTPKLFWSTFSRPGSTSSGKHDGGDVNGHRSKFLWEETLT